MTRRDRELDHTPSSMGSQIVFAENLAWLRDRPSERFRLIYIDPPFNTGKRQTLTQIQTERDEHGDRTGFGGQRYRTTVIGKSSYSDSYDAYLSFLRKRISLARDLLTEDGSFFLHVDPREVHYCKVMMDEVFGRSSFVNEIIWSYDFGGRSKRRWPAKHDNILWYAKDPSNYRFNYDSIDRIPYMAPSLVSPEKAALGKVPTDVWWQTIVPTNGHERTGYPTQKPIAILERIVKVHTDPGDVVLDFFAGSGTTGDAAARNGREFVLVDDNPEAVRIMAKRLKYADPSIIGVSEESKLARSLAL